MEEQPQKKSEAGDGAEAEDIPSDFFDDFNKADFIEGLSVIDSWDDKEKGHPKSDSDRPRFSAEAFDKVKDLRELMSDENREGYAERQREDGSRDYTTREDGYRSRRDGDGFRDERSRGDTLRDDRRIKNELSRQRRSSSHNRLNEFIKPGSRRDPNKTNEAIKRDKEEKVKEFLAKSLESSDDLRPPGTELDDYYEGSKAEKKVLEPLPLKPHSRERERDRRRESPRKLPHRRSPRWSPKRSPIRRRPSRSPRRSPRRTAHWRPNSPITRTSFKRYRNFSPGREGHMGPRREGHMSPRREGHMSPRREGHMSPRRSPRRYSPRRSPLRSSRYSRSRSPVYRRPHRSRSPSIRDNFLYPEPEPELSPYGPPAHYPMGQQFGPSGGSPHPGSPHTGPPGYPPYGGSSAYSGYGPPYDYVGPPMPVSQPPTPLMSIPVPAPVSIPVPLPTSNHILQVPNPILAPTGHVPAMVPAPTMVPSTPPSKPMNTETPYDALAKLVAEGKISKADYLKLAPNKGSINASTNDKNRVMVLNRCSTALNKLKSLDLPNQLLFNHGIKLGVEPKYIGPKYCSPLKREPPVDFQFTCINGPGSSQQNKLLIDSIIAAVGLEKVVARPKKTLKNMKEVACQTSKPYCDVCEIRAATTTSIGTTSIDHEYFCSSVHTQVVEQDLASSKSVFNPSGSVSDNPSMSIAHLTPAQLVSQLAARAKTLKKPEPVPTTYRRNDYDYNYDRGQGQQYQNYNNYRY